MNLADIILVNWNAGKQLADAIDSILCHHHGWVGRIIVVDNASTDGSIELAESRAASSPLEMVVIRNTENLGFAAACNLGAERANHDFLLFLNPDACLYPDSLPKAMEFFSRPGNADVGIVGIQLLDEDGRVARSCARFPTAAIFLAQATGLNRLGRLASMNTHMSDWAHDSTREVDHVIGAFYLIRKPLFDSLNGFDERFFVYLEDLDLSLRARQAGYRSVYLADAQAFHAGGGTSRQIKATRLFYSLRSRLLYGFKHFSPWQAWLLVWVTFLLEPISRSVFAWRNKGRIGVANTWNAYAMLIGDFSGIRRLAKQKSSPTMARFRENRRLL